MNSIAPSPHFSRAFYCGGASRHVYCVALRRAPRRTVEYVCGALSRAPCIHARLRRLATKPREKCGLVPRRGHSLFANRLVNFTFRLSVAPVPVPVTIALSGCRMHCPLASIPALPAATDPPCGCTSCCNVAVHTGNLDNLNPDGLLVIGVERVRGGLDPVAKALSTNRKA